MLRKLSFLLIPGTCQLCTTPSNREFDLCIHCENALPLNEGACKLCALPHPCVTNNVEICVECMLSRPPLDLVHAGFIFSPLIKTMLHRIKFNKGTLDSFLLSHLLAKQLALVYASQTLPQLILPVPLSLLRLMQRGYNQSAGIASQLGKELNIPVNYKLLKRTLHTKPQTQLNREARQAALTAAFKVSGKLPCKHIALVDDVMTTGATLHAQALCLYQAGAQSVHAWVLVRTPKRT